MSDILKAFAAVLEAEKAVSSAAKELDDATIMLSLKKSQAETELNAAWQAVETIMKETGEFEVNLPGEYNDYVIYYSKPSKRVKASTEATPDEFIKIERKPKLKEIGDHLKELLAKGEPLPNWAAFEEGTPKLCWKAKKK